MTSANTLRPAAGTADGLPFSLIPMLSISYSFCDLLHGRRLVGRVLSLCNIRTLAGLRTAPSRSVPDFGFGSLQSFRSFQPLLFATMWSILVLIYKGLNILNSDPLKGGSCDVLGFSSDGTECRPHADRARRSAVLRIPGGLWDLPLVEG